MKSVAAALCSLATMSAAAPLLQNQLPLCNATQMGNAANPINVTKCSEGCPELPQCASVTTGGVCRMNCAHPQFPPSDRRLMAWVGGDVDNPANRARWGGMAAVVQQLQANPGLFTGVMGFCGWAFDTHGQFYTKNVTKNGQCAGTINDTKKMIPGGADLFAEVQRQQLEFQPVIALDDPFAAMVNVTPYIESFAAVAKQHGWTGFNLDWEGANTTGTEKDFLNFVELNNAFADGLAAHGLRYSTDVQWVTQWTGGKPTAELDALLGAGRAKWITMDTYYYSTGRVLDALDFYATRVSREHLGVGMASTEPSPNADGFAARIHALRSYGITEVDMFMMPTTETWMPWLRKWKNDCRGCGNGGALSCFAEAGCY